MNARTVIVWCPYMVTVPPLRRSAGVVATISSGISSAKNPAAWHGGSKLRQRTATRSRRFREGGFSSEMGAGGVMETEGRVVVFGGRTIVGGG